MIDLHCHSTASDGALSPNNLVQLAHNNGVSVLALTDHDTIDGIAEASVTAAGLGMRLIPGTELSCEFGANELHIVGLFLDTSNAELLAFFNKLKTFRLDRNIALLSSLQQQGIPITVEELCVNGKQLDSVGRPNFARILTAKGYAKNVFEAFDKYLSNKAAQTVKRVKITDAEAIDMIHKAGGLAILAHPDQTGLKTHQELACLVSDLKSKGLDGMEVYYNGDKRARIKDYKRIARQYDLLVSGGSDFHSFDKGTRSNIGFYNIGKPIPDEILTMIDNYRR